MSEPIHLMLLSGSSAAPQELVAKRILGAGPDGEIFPLQRLQWVRWTQTSPKELNPAAPRSDQEKHLKAYADRVRAHDGETWAREIVAYIRERSDLGLEAPVRRFALWGLDHEVELRCLRIFCQYVDWELSHFWIATERENTDDEKNPLRGLADFVIWPRADLFSRAAKAA